MLLFHPDLVDLGRPTTRCTRAAAEPPNYDVLPIASATRRRCCLSPPVESSREKGAILRNVAVKQYGGSREARVLGRRGDYHEV